MFRVEIAADKKVEIPVSVKKADAKYEKFPINTPMFDLMENNMKFDNDAVEENRD